MKITCENKIQAAKKLFTLVLSQHLKLTNRKCPFHALETNPRACDSSCCELSVCQKHLTQKWLKQSLFNSNNYSPCSLCLVNHSSICWSSSGNFGVKRPMVVRFVDIFNSPLNSLAWSFRQRRPWTHLVHTRDRSPSCFRQLQLRQQPRAWKPCCMMNDELLAWWK